MKLFAAVLALIFVCISALLQVWAAPIEDTKLQNDHILIDPEALYQAFINEHIVSYERLTKRYTDLYTKGMALSNSQSSLDLPFPSPPNFPPIPPSSSSQE